MDMEQSQRVVCKLQRLCQTNRVEIGVLSGNAKVFLWVTPNGFLRGFKVTADTLEQALDEALANGLSAVGENHPIKHF